MSKVSALEDGKPQIEQNRMIQKKYPIGPKFLSVLPVTTVIDHAPAAIFQK
jgi:hypothetical protein